jgi:hypothetical protein
MTTQKEITTKSQEGNNEIAVNQGFTYGGQHWTKAMVKAFKAAHKPCHTSAPNIAHPTSLQYFRRDQIENWMLTEEYATLAARRTGWRLSGKRRVDMTRDETIAVLAETQGGVSL